MLTHNTRKTDTSIPVVIEDERGFPFAPGERAAEWHETTDSEYATYLEYWNKIYDQENAK